VLSIAMVAYYTTAYDVTSRIALIPQAIVGVLFPTMAGRFAAEPSAVKRLFSWGLRLTSALAFPVTFVLVLFGPEIMRLWLGEVFARQSGPVLRWIAAGMFLNCMAQVALAVVQSSGRPRWSALLHVIELPLYLGSLLVLLRLHGIEGAAQAWFLRVVVDVVALFVFAAHRTEGGRSVALEALALGGVGLASMAVGVLLATPIARLIYGAAIGCALAWWSYRWFSASGRILWEQLQRARTAPGT